MVQKFYHDHVFINCPFDSNYITCFQAMIFVIFDCGYVPRSALEIEDSGDVRFDKITRLIAECKFGLHDLSRIEVDPTSQLPRFNMPLELGLFLGAKRFGNKNQNSKVCLILDKKPFRYQAFISDIAGQDIQYHNNNDYDIIIVIRNWLRSFSTRNTIPGGEAIVARYRLFKKDLPGMCTQLRLNENRLTYTDFNYLVSIWLKEIGN